jgi:hypothetical protein
MTRRTGWRAVKSHESYTVEEVARNQGVAKGTVRRWLKNSLPALHEKRPCLILGGDLVDFLKRQKKPKQTCKPEECYCFKCKAPRKAAIGEAEYQPITSTNGQLIALCGECTTLMHKRVSLATLKALNGILKISIRQQAKPIGKGEHASLNDH